MYSHEYTQIWGQGIKFLGYLLFFLSFSLKQPKIVNFIKFGPQDHRAGLNGLIMFDKKQKSCMKCIHLVTYDGSYTTEKLFTK